MFVASDLHTRVSIPLFVTASWEADSQLEVRNYKVVQIWPGLICV